MEIQSIRFYALTRAWVMAGNWSNSYMTVGFDNFLYSMDIFDNWSCWAFFFQPPGLLTGKYDVCIFLFLVSTFGKCSNITGSINLKPVRDVLLIRNCIFLTPYRVTRTYTTKYLLERYWIYFYHALYTYAHQLSYPNMLSVQLSYA